MEIAHHVMELVKEWLAPTPRQGTREVKRSRKTYLEEQHWRRTGFGLPARWVGWYRTRYGSYRGKIECSTPPKFFVKDPPEGLSRHRHHMCFSEKSGGWWSVHFRTQPKDLDSGVMELERIFHEAYLLSKKTG
jgi:hypothetical protein